VQQSAEKVAALGERSAEIGQIVQAIDDIASQTNLLCLYLPPWPGNGGLYASS
jgi:methyl-accepting chemotaxis protein